MKINVFHIAKLANLILSDARVESLEKQLSDTLDHVERLNELNTDAIEPTSQVTGLENITRDDIVSPSLSQQEALQNAKKTYKGFFVVDAILEE